MFVIGTAGHIDHGKSAIIKRLTGTDPDRLPEEQERGMTIDIGFAHYDSGTGQRIGIIDVPGHERFVRNMIAGSGGIDAVILVVAADDGWMPQSQEHFQITKLLNIKYGMVAITKIDLVESGWVELVAEDLKEKLKGSFLEGTPMVRLSSITGEGFETLKKEIDKLAEKVVVREDIGKPRLFIDRSFVLAGMGGVVAGTLRGGQLAIGREVSVFPSKKTGKVRTMQSHGEQVEKAFPGQRTSISLTGIDKEYLGRGKVISTPEIVTEYPDNPTLALKVSLIPESPVVLDNRRKLLMILGTTEVEGEVRVFNDIPIPPGGEGIMFFKPFDSVLSFIGDRFILRLPTPQMTVGGGEVVDILQKFPRKKKLSSYQYLHDRCDLNLENLVETELTKTTFINISQNFRWCNYSEEEVQKYISHLTEGQITDQYLDKYYRVSDLSPIIDKITSALTAELEIKPHIDGLAIDVIATGSGQSVTALESILKIMCNKGILLKKKNKYDIPGRTVKVKGEIKQTADEMERFLKEKDFMPPLVKELLGKDKSKKEALEFLVVSGKVVKAGTTLAFHYDAWMKILAGIREILNVEKQLKVSALREKLGSSRKYIVPILEETDRRQITIRQGDVRIKGVNFDKE